MGRFHEVYRRSLEDPEGFWAEAAEGVAWTRRWDRVLDDSKSPFTRWFVGGETNTCYNAVDRHVEAGRGGQPALIYDSPVTGTVATFTYAELQDRVARFAGALRRLGVGYGDRVILYMPMIPEAVVAMLASGRIGAIHSVVFGGFAAKELATRIDDARPKVIVSASCGIEGQRVLPYKPLLDRAIELSAHKPERCVIKQRPQAEAELVAGRDLTWEDAEAGAEPAACVPVKATDPAYILYTSGTTGQPKGVVRPTGGHLVALKWSMKNIYDVDPGDVYWAASDVGWVVGHSYIVYAPLFHGCTTVLYEGKPVGTPDAGAFWRVIADHKVKVMFTAPTAIRAIKKEDPDGKLLANYDLSHFRAQFLAGERCDPDTLKWCQDKLKVPAVDHWWQTETGWPIASNCLGIEELPYKPGSPTHSVPGWNVQVLAPEGTPVQPNEIGAISIKLPLPPGALSTLWNNDDRFVQSYMTEYPGFYQTGDAGLIDDDGYLHVMTRTDDIINVAGHRLSTGGMEEVLASHPDVAECAVIGVADDLKGQVPLGFLVLKDGVNKPHDQVVKEVVALVRERIGPVAAFKVATVVQRLPKTRSGKILRGTMQKIADGQEPGVPATIDDPAILGEIAESLQGVGYAKKG
ncbi:MAG: propionyl-CoA synthetase [Thalassobaculum sp.]|uniref:propionyl-CoA synthetase n=1 Tax=Thalassobaculum sp. TaxID=2022740 RepID=UPI0032EEE268